MKKMIKVRDLCRVLNGQDFKILGRQNRLVKGLSAIDEGNKYSLSYCNPRSRNPRQLIKESKCGAIICADLLEFAKDDYRHKTLILTKSPRLAFILIAEAYFPEARPDYAVHPTAVIDPRAKIYRDVYIGPHTFIGECEIGEGTIIYGNVHIYSGTKIGKRVVIHAGTVIGADGFGYERLQNGEFKKMPHFGGVLIGDDVEIGSNTSIDRNIFGDTVIGEGTKIDNLVHIAHNVKIGKHCSIIAQAMIGGSVEIGDYSRIAPSACVRDGVRIGHHATVGLGAVVTKDIPDNLIVMGCPAKPAEIYKKMLKIIERMVEASEK